LKFNLLFFFALATSTVLIMESEEMKESTPSDVYMHGTVDTLSVEEEKKLVRKIDMRYVLPEATGVQS
jgi:hypothetical protein